MSYKSLSSKLGQVLEKHENIRKYISLNQMRHCVTVYITTIKTVSPLHSMHFMSLIIYSIYASTTPKLVNNQRRRHSVMPLGAVRIVRWELWWADAMIWNDKKTVLFGGLCTVRISARLHWAKRKSLRLKMVCFRRWGMLFKSYGALGFSIYFIVLSTKILKKMQDFTF